MPWSTLKRDCKQSDGKSGSYVVLKKKSGGGTEQASCHTSEEKAKGAVGARYTNEGRKMRITGRQIMRLIREAIEPEQNIPGMEPGSGHESGYMVPDFESEEDMMLFVDELEPDDQVNDDVINPETGETWIYAGESPLDAGLKELEPEETVETEEEELDNYDWEGWEAEHEARLEKQRDDYERVLEKVQDEAREAGEDWAGDTLYDAQNNPDLWKQYGSQTAVDYVMAFGQDAAGDVADSLASYSMDPEVSELYDSLKSEYDEYGGGFYGVGTAIRDDSGRPSKQIFKDILADSFYDGVSRALEKKRAEAAA